MALIPASSTLVTVEAALVRCDAAIEEALRALGLNRGAVSSPPIVPVSGGTIPPTLAQHLGNFPGDKSDELYAAFRDAAKICGLHPEVLYAIWCWETGRGKDPNAGPWIHGFNPGGLHFNSVKEAQGLGALSDPYISQVSQTRYLAFTTWYDGILGLGRFLLRDHYDVARAESTIEGQVHAIWAAGYSELSPDWLTNVRRVATTVTLATASHTEPGAHPAERSATVPDRIVAALLSLVGHPKDSSDPVFTYPEETENGNLGCASAISQALVIAGVISKAQFQLSVSGLAHLLVDLGWNVKPRPDRNADMIVWKPATGGTHQHIGGLVLIDGKQYAVENSSSRRVVEKVLLETFNRQISYALQCPA